MLNFYIK